MWAVKGAHTSKHASQCKGPGHFKGPGSNATDSSHHRGATPQIQPIAQAPLPPPQMHADSITNTKSNNESQREGGGRGRCTSSKRRPGGEVGNSGCRNTSTHWPPPTRTPSSALHPARCVRSPPVSRKQITNQNEGCAGGGQPGHTGLLLLTARCEKERTLFMKNTPQRPCARNHMKCAPLQTQAAKNHRN